MKCKINKYGLILSIVLYLMQPLIYNEEILMTFYNQYRYVDVLVTVIGTIVCVGMAYVSLNRTKSSVIKWKEMIVSVFIGYFVAMLLPYLITIVLRGKVATKNPVMYTVFDSANIKYLLFMLIYIIVCFQAAVYIKNREDMIAQKYSMGDKIKLILMGIITSAILYLAYPYIKFHYAVDTYLHNYYEVISWVATIACAAAAYGLNYWLTKKIEINNINGWKYILIGTTIGMGLTLATLLLLSSKAQFGTYLYIDTEIPFNLFNLCYLKYYLYVTMYAIFFREIATCYKIRNKE